MSTSGGKNYPAGTYSPLTGTMYYPLQNTCMMETSGERTLDANDNSLYRFSAKVQIAPGENWAKRPDEQLQSDELRRHIQDAVDALPELYRTVFLLPILVHGVLGLLISTRADLHMPRPARAWYGNVAFYLQRVTGIALFG